MTDDWLIHKRFSKTNLSKKSSKTWCLWTTFHFHFLPYKSSFKLQFSFSTITFIMVYSVISRFSQNAVWHIIIESILHSLEKREILPHRKNNSWNQLFSKTIDFTKLLHKKMWRRIVHTPWKLLKIPLTLFQETLPLLLTE